MVSSIFDGEDEVVKQIEIRSASPTILSFLKRTAARYPYVKVYIAEDYSSIAKSIRKEKIRCELIDGEM